MEGGARVKVDSEITDRVHRSDVVAANSDRDTEADPDDDSRHRPEDLGIVFFLIFTARRSNASAVLKVVILSVRPSHACLERNERTYYRYFDTV